MLDTLSVRLIGPDKGFDYVTLISISIGFSGFVFGTYQFFLSKRWKRLEYLDSLMKRFREDPLLKAASMLLDWESRPIAIGSIVVNYDIKMLPHALADHRTFKSPSDEGFNDDEVAIRDAFDSLFDFIGSIEYAVQLKMVAYKDIFCSPMAYFLFKIIEKEKMTDGAVLKYVKAYGFESASRLLSIYQKWIKGKHKA